MLSNLSELVSEFSSDTGHCTVEVMADNLSSSHLVNELESPTQSVEIRLVKLLQSSDSNIFENNPCYSHIPTDYLVKIHL